MAQRSVNRWPVALVILVTLAGGFAGCESREVTARTFEVVRVVDGDTFRIVYDGEAVSVRFLGIDAPEPRGSGGRAATEYLERLIGGRVVRIEFTGPRKRDNFGRLLCRVYLDGLDVGKTGTATNI